MARDFASVNVEIWSDPEWRGLPPAAQHLYLLLWTSPGLSYCGVHDWRPGRLAALSHGFTAEHIDTVADTLSARHFLVIDEDTEEVLIRSWARFDGLMKKPRMAVSYANAYAAVASAKLRSVMAYETSKLREMLPELACWGDSRVAAILSHPAVSAKDLPTPSDPFADGFTTAFTQGLPQTAGDVCQGTYLPPTPAPTPTPSTNTPTAFRDKRGAAADAAGFETFWAAYPRKIAKGAALKAWKTASRKTDAETITAAVKAQASTLTAKGSDFCPHAATWLNGERWNDDTTQQTPLRAEGWWNN